MESALNSTQSSEARFSIFLIKYFFIAGQSQKNQYFWKKIYFCWKIFDHENNKTKIRLHNFVRNSMQILNTYLLVFVLALIVFDFYYEISKINNQKKHKNPNLFKNYSENQKISRTKSNFFSNYTWLCCVNFTSIG